MGVCSRGHAGSWYGHVRTHLQWGHPSGDPVPKDTWNSSGCSPLGTHSRAGSGDIPLGMCLRGGSGDTSVGTPLRGHSREVGAYLWGHPLAVTRAVGTSILGHGGGGHHVGLTLGTSLWGHAGSGNIPLGIHQLCVRLGVGHSGDSGWTCCQQGQPLGDVVAPGTFL